MTIAGPACSIHCREDGLELPATLSGIATMTKSFVDVVSGTGVKILIHAKQHPDGVKLKKAAVRNGGGYNHRMGLYDMVMVKDNHFCRGSLEETQTAIELRQTIRICIEIEADNLEQVKRSRASRRGRHPSRQHGS